jgi:hypothetical protein
MFAFSFNLRRYSMELNDLRKTRDVERAEMEAGAYTRPLFGST